MIDKNLEEQIARNNSSLEKHHNNIADNSWKWNKVKSLKFANSEPSDKMYLPKTTPK